MLAVLSIQSVTAELKVSAKASSVSRLVIIEFSTGGTATYDVIIMVLQDTPDLPKDIFCKDPEECQELGQTHSTAVSAEIQHFRNETPRRIHHTGRCIDVLKTKAGRFEAKGPTTGSLATTYIRHI